MFFMYFPILVDKVLAWFQLNNVIIKLLQLATALITQILLKKEVFNNLCYIDVHSSFLDRHLAEHMHRNFLTHIFYHIITAVGWSDHKVCSIYFSVTMFITALTKCIYLSSPFNMTVNMFNLLLLVLFYIVKGLIGRQTAQYFYLMNNCYRVLIFWN